MKKIILIATVTAAIAGVSSPIVSHAEGIHKVNNGNKKYINYNREAVAKKDGETVENNSHSIREITRLSAIFESNGNPGSISTGVGDFGGKSYGAWQFSSKTGTLTEFMNYLQRENYDFYFALVRSEYKDKAKKIQYGDAFDRMWTKIANQYPDTFYDLQMDFVKVNYYDKLARLLRRNGGFAKQLSNLAVQNVMLSTAVQNGVRGAYNIIRPFAYTKSPEKLIEEIYKRRALTNGNGVLVNFSSSSKEVQSGVKNRLSREEAVALNML